MYEPLAYSRRGWTGPFVIQLPGYKIIYNTAEKFITLKIKRYSDFVKKKTI